MRAVAGVSSDMVNRPLPFGVTRARRDGVPEDGGGGATTLPDGIELHCAVR